MFQSDHYSYKHSIFISQYRLEDTCRKFLSLERSFNLVHKSESTAYTFYATSEEQKSKSMKAIQDAM